MGVAFQALAALVGSTLFDVRGLTSVAVFFLGINYAPTALASLRLIALRPERPLRLPGLLGDVRDCSRYAACTSQRRQE